MSDIFPSGFLSPSNTEEIHKHLYCRDLAKFLDLAQALVIDDEENILNILRTLLVKLDFEVNVAYDGREGIELFDDGHGFDLVITDIRMIWVEGNQVAKHIRVCGKPDTPIVAISGYEKEIDKGIFDFSITKPFRLETIIDEIKKIKREPKSFWIKTI